MEDKIDLRDIQRLDVRPGDRLLVTVSRQVTLHEVEYIRDTFRRQLPGVEVLIKAEDVKVEVISAEQTIADAVAEATANPGRTVEVKE